MVVPKKLSCMQASTRIPKKTYFIKEDSSSTANDKIIEQNQGD